jgi:hypothetical protein
MLDNHIFSDNSPGENGFPNLKMVEAVGIEPTSEDTPELTATCLVGFQFSRAASSETDKYDAVASREISRYKGFGSPCSQPVLSSPYAAPQAGIMRRTWLHYLCSQSQIIVGNCIVFPFFNEAWVLGMLSNPDYIPVETVSPPFEKWTFP